MISGGRRGADDQPKQTEVGHPSKRKLEIQGEDARAEHSSVRLSVASTEALLCLKSVIDSCRQLLPLQQRKTIVVDLRAHPCPSRQQCPQACASTDVHSFPRVLSLRLCAESDFK
jgi:hypothetical protein